MLDTGALESARGVLEVVGFGVGLIGAGVLVWGVVRAVPAILRAEVGRARGIDPAGDGLRHVLGGHLLLGMEILVAADIIETISNPSLERLGVLGAIVAIRTVISISLHWELARGAHAREA